MRVQKIVDLSVPVGPSTQVFPGDPVAALTVHSTIAEHGFNLLRVEMGSQTGTHVDAPYHFSDTGSRIDQIPVERFVGRGVVANVRDIGPREPIMWQSLGPYAGTLAEGDVLLLHTGWSQHFGTARYFDHPYLDADACRRLLALGVRTVGIDAINLDETPDHEHPGVGYPVHHLLAAADGIIIENLRNLELIDFRDPMVSVLPIAFENGDGAPTRAVAMQLEV